jgi:hypothetical protein
VRPDFSRRIRAGVAAIQRPWEGPGLAADNLSTFQPAIGSGVPTVELWVPHTTRELCNIFRTGRTIEAQSTGHLSSVPSGPSVLLLLIFIKRLGLLISVLNAYLIL